MNKKKSLSFCLKIFGFFFIGSLLFSIKFSNEENLERNIILGRHPEKIPSHNFLLNNNKTRREVNGSVSEMTTTGKPIYILWSRWRRGSSFLGKLLSSAKSNTFYSYEPLHALGLRVFRDNKAPEVKYGLRFLSDVMHCRYGSYQQMLKYFLETEFYFFYNPLTKHRCKPVKTCSRSQLLDQLCEGSSLQVIKLLRLSLKYGSYILKKNPNVKIIYLARDPRGTFKSRSRILWCVGTKDCHDHETACQLLEEDLGYSQKLRELYPDRFFFLRYEDLSLNTEEVFTSLWKSLGEQFTPRITRLVQSLSSENLQNGIYGLRKNSKQNTFSWRSSLDYFTLKKIQKICQNPMTNLGYNQYSSEEEYENKTIPAMAKRWNSPLNISHLHNVHVKLPVL